MIHINSTLLTKSFKDVIPNGCEEFWTRPGDQIPRTCTEPVEVAVASFATDGEDGPTPAAGAVVSGETAEYARTLGLEPSDFLHRNDSFHFFQHLDESFRQVDVADGSEKYLPITLLTPGPTGTNVNDLLIILTYPADDEDADSMES